VITKDEEQRNITSTFVLDRDSRRLLRGFSAARMLSMSEVIRMGIRAVCEPKSAA